MTIVAVSKDPVSDAQLLTIQPMSAITDCPHCDMQMEVKGLGNLSGILDVINNEIEKHMEEYHTEIEDHGVGWHTKVSGYLQEQPHYMN